MSKFVCTTPCWYDSHNYRLGDIVDTSPANLPKGKKGELRHFRALDPGVPTTGSGGTTVKVNAKDRAVG
jgi:hypothetical protein